MTETQQIPDAVRWAVAALDTQDRRSTTLQADLEHYEGQLADALARRRELQQEMQAKLQRDAELAELIDQLKQMHRDKGAELTKASQNAAHLRRMVEVVCQDEGITPPAPPPEPVLHETGEFPIVADPQPDHRNGNARPTPAAVDARRQHGVCPACRINHTPWCTGNAEPIDDAGEHRIPGGEQHAPFRPGPQRDTRPDA